VFLLPGPSLRVGPILSVAGMLPAGVECRITQMRDF
jgi:hypothetical protein